MAQEFDATEARNKIASQYDAARKIRAFFAENVLDYLEKKHPRSQREYDDFMASMRKWTEATRSELADFARTLR